MVLSAILLVLVSIVLSTDGTTVAAFQNHPVQRSLLAEKNSHQSNKPDRLRNKVLSRPGPSVRQVPPLRRFLSQEASFPYENAIQDNDESRALGFLPNIFKNELFHWALVGGMVFAAAYLILLQSLPFSFETLLESYKLSMIQHPLQTKVATGASLAVVGDAVAQMREPGDYSSQRAVSFALFDSCYRMFQHIAFPAIVRMCQGRMLGGIISAVLPTFSLGAESSGVIQLFATMERTLAYQFGVVPLFYYPIFFAFTGLLQGLSIQQTYQRAKDNFFPCWRRNLMFWIPIQMVMFGLVDEKWQIPFVCVMGMAWSTILSVTAGKVKT
jgi:protein Mpv17